VDAEGAAQAHKLIEQQRRLICQRVVFLEEALELIHDEQDTREGFASFLAVICEVLYMRCGEKLATPLKFFGDLAQNTNWRIH